MTPIAQRSPEEEANELHHQPVGRAIAWTLCLAFLAVITLRPLFLLRSPEVRQDFATFFASLGKAFADGGGPRQINRGARAAISEFDGDLEKKARFSERLLPPWHQAMAWLGTGHETVHVGRDGWLEYRPAFEYVTGSPILDRSRFRRWPGADPRPALRLLAEDLKARGIALWVVPVPSKVMVYPEGFAPSLAGAAGDGVGNPSFPTFRRGLENAGIRVFDPLPALRSAAAKEPVYFKTDSHWKPAGIEATAAALAAALEAEVPLAPRSREWRRKPDPIDYPGDLARMLHLEHTPAYPAEPVKVEMVTDERGRLWKPEPAAEVLVLGDSFSNIFAPRAGNLPAQLAYHLGRPVDRLVMDGGGPLGTREALDRELRQDPARLATTKVVVLEFAARELTIGRWRVIRLPKMAP